MPSLFSQVFTRDRGRCVYCGRNLLADFDSFYCAQKDHLVPSAGDAPENVVLACYVCNNLRGSFVPTVSLTPNSRREYIHQIRCELMLRRAKALQDFASWTHPVDPAP